MHSIPFPTNQENSVRNPAASADAPMADVLALLDSGQGLDRQLYQRAYDFALLPLAEKLRQGDLGVEAQLLMVIRRLADHLLAERQPEFVELVAFVNALPLCNPASRQWCTYYTGVAHLRTEQYEQADALFNSLLGAVDLEAAVRGRTLNSRSICLRVAGKYEEALSGYRESLSIWQRLDDKANAGKALLNMGMTAYYLQNYSDAEAWFSEAAIHFDQTGMIILQGAAQNGLGLVHRDQGQWQEALDCFQTYIGCGEEKDAADFIGTGKLNVAEILLFQGRIPEAITTLQAALGYMERRLHRVDVYLNLGLAYQAMDKLKAARVAFQQASDLAYKIERLEILPHVEYRLGLIAQQMGDNEGALGHLESAVGFIEASRQPMDDEGLKISLLGTWQQIYEALVLHCMDTDEHEQAFVWAERARARAFTEELLKHSPAGDLLEADVPIERQNASVTALQDSIPESSTVLAYYTTGVLATDIPMLRAIPEENPLRRHLLTPARTILFLGTPTHFSAVECPIDPNLFSTMSPRGYDLDRWLEPSVLSHLSQTLFSGCDRLWASTDKDGNRGHSLAMPGPVYIIPHGPLHLVPFTALLNLEQQGKDDGSCDVTYAPSATILRHSLAPPHRNRAHSSSLAVGYNGKRDGQQLRHTEAEVLRVAQLMKGKAQIGSAPKKENLRAAAAEFGWLHFACHGWFDHNQPLESYLETGEAERLLAQEIMDSWTLTAELVTLSACQTGVSRVLRGDEPMGLVRAFLYAGARSVLVSQWPVDDLATYLLMQQFYGLMVEKQEPNLSVCLSKAQRWLRRLTTAEVAQLVETHALDNHAVTDLLAQDKDARPFTHPRYWAAFTLVTGG